LKINSQGWSLIFSIGTLLIILFIKRFNEPSDG